MSKSAPEKSVPESVPDTPLLQSGREVCPMCNRKGLGYANHPHAFGWKDYGRASCRYCGARLPVDR